MKNFVEDQTRNIDLSAFRTTSAFILATSFSMIIFLLSLIKERNLILDLGIMLLFFSVVILFDMYISSIFYENQLIYGKTESKRVLKIERKFEGMGFLGLTFFYLGLLFLIFYFNLFIVFIFFTIYLWYKGIADLRLRISVFKKIKKGYNEFKKKSGHLVNMLETLKVGKNSEIIYLILRVTFLISVIIISMILMVFLYLILI